MSTAHLEKYTVRDAHKEFYEDFLPEDLGIDSSHDRIDMPLLLFKKIIKTYLEIYFSKLYFSNRKSLYFFLGGRMKVVAIPPFKSPHHNKITRAVPGWLWYLRPSFESWYFVKLRKLTGTTNIMTKFDERYIAEKNVDSLQYSYHAVGEIIENKTNFAR